jgi:hypothetical protein
MDVGRCPGQPFQLGPLEVLKTKELLLRHQSSTSLVCASAESPEFLQAKIMQ